MEKHNYKSIAQDFYDKEIPVTPVHNKRPVIKEWTQLTDDSILGKEFNSAWRQANGIGLLLGEASGIVCLDIDIVPQMPELLPVLEEINKILPPTQCGLVGNPLKPPARFYKFTGQRSQKFNYLHIEILADGNQKVIPPSWNPQAKQNYEWTGQSILEIDIDDLQEIPDGLLEYLHIENENFRERKRGGSKEAPSLVAESGRCNHGSHNLISHRALSLFYQGFKFDDLVEEIIRYDNDINKNADAKYFQCPSRPEFKGYPTYLNAQAFAGEVIHRNVKRRFEKTNFFKEELANGFTWKDDNGRPHRQHISLYNFMKLKHDIWYTPEVKSFMVWDGKRYVRRLEDYVKKFAQDHFKQPVCTKIADRVTFLELAKNMQQGCIDDFVLRDTGLVNLKNGTLNVEKAQLKPHRKADKLPVLIDVNWPEEVLECPVWDELLDLVTVGRKHMQTAIEEFVGYCLSGASYDRFNKFLILDGGGSNGKSTLIRVIRDLIGGDNCSYVSLESITKERFAAFSLVNKLVNFCSEEPKEAFANTGAIKKITGGDAIMVEEKHKGAFGYENIAKLVISYNKMPFFPDDSTGMKRRIILIPCDMNFEEQPNKKIEKPEKRIRDHEQPAVLRRCIEAYRKVIERGEFTSVEEGTQRVEEMVVESDPVKKFITEHVVKAEPNFYVSTNLIWEWFKEFQGGNTKHIRSNFMTSFGMRVKKMHNCKAIKEGSQRGYLGIRIEGLSERSEPRVRF